MKGKTFQESKEVNDPLRWVNIKNEGFPKSTFEP